MGAVRYDRHGNIAATPLPPRPVTVLEQRAHPGLSQCLKTLMGHRQGVESLAMAPGGEYLISSGGDHNIKVWRRTNGEEVNTLSGHTSRVREVRPHVSDNVGVKEGKGGGVQVVTVSDDMTIRIWPKAVPNTPAHLVLAEEA